MHPDVRPHAPEGVALVPADRAAERLDALVGVHVALGRPGGRADGPANGAPPAARLAARGARVRDTRLDYRLQRGTRIFLSCELRIDKNHL